MLPLLLQKSFRYFNRKYRTKSLKKRRQYDRLVREKRFIQFKLVYQNSPTSVVLIAKKFKNFMLTGR